MNEKNQVVTLGTSGNCWLRRVFKGEGKSVVQRRKSFCVGHFKYILSWPNDALAEAAASVCRGGGVDQKENGHLATLGKRETDGHVRRET